MLILTRSTRSVNRKCPVCNNANYMIYILDISKKYKYKCCNCGCYFESDSDLYIGKHERGRKDEYVGVGKTGSKYCL